MKSLRIMKMVVTVLFLLFPGILYGQDTEDRQQSHWGITASIVPSWEIASGLKRIFETPTVALRGSEFQVGFVRGREFGGDWGVSLVRKKISDARFDESEPTCTFHSFGVPGGTFTVDPCVRYGDRYTMKEAYVTGAEIHKYAPLVTIKKRAQIGLNFAGGIGAIQGEAEKRSQSFRFIYSEGRPGTTYAVDAIQNEDVVVSISAKEAFKETTVLPFVPLGKAELVVGVMPAPGLKIKFSGGINFPGVQRFSVGMSYLFGTHD